MIKKITFLTFFLFSLTIVAQTTLVSSGDTWKYYYNSSAPANDGEGDTWKENAFNDASWSSGASKLGNDHSPATSVGNNPVVNTTYFRHTFNVADASIFSDISLRAIRDDGIVVYLNGTEIWRDNMPAGVISHGTLANSPAVGGSDETTWYLSGDLSESLITGSNTIAVEIHQVNSTSSDISFDLELFANPVSDIYISDGDTWKYYDAGNEPSNDGEGDTWKEIAFNDGGWSSGPSELGYGDTQATAISNSTLTGYFRKSFTVTDHTIYSDLSLEAIRDDGMIVYLNGTEIWRDNMPAGVATYNTFASGVIGGTDETTWITETIASSLVTGTNVIAVEVHQENAGSSDISFNFKLTANGAVPAELERGPYLQSGTSSSVVIKWRTNTSTESIVNFGTSLGALSDSESDITLKIDHEITLTGLTPNTKYYYEIADNDGVFVPESSDMFIVTAPTIGTDQFVRAWILGDPGTTGNGTYGNDQQDVRDAYYAYVDETGPTGSITNPNQTDMILFLGDNAYNSGTDSEYQAGFFDVYDDILKNTVAWSCLGNHDSYSVDFNTQSGPYYDIFTFPTAGEIGGTASGTEEYYSFDYANIHFIVLQSENVDGGGNEPAFNTAQKAWLTTDINATSQDWIVAFFHHPPYTKGSHDSDNAGENGIFTMREQYIPILEAGGVDLILSGHSHSYERSKFVKGHTGLSGTFNPAQTTSGGHTVGANGNLSGRADTGDLAYTKTDTDIDGAVYITAGSSGKATGAQFNGQDPYTGANTLPVMYYSAQSLGSTILEIEDDGSGGQNMNIKFLRDTGVIDDYFTINKSGVTLSTESSDFSDRIKLFPVPANSLLNIEVSQGENLKNIKIYDAIGKVVKETSLSQINVSSLNSGLYIVQITTDKNEYFKNIIIK
jgi:hypothetical protein